MKAVHFGAGNIGRGFVGLLLSNAGYELVFADVAEALIDGLRNSDSYAVHEVGDDPRTTVVRGYSALNSAKQADELTAAIAEADIVTTAVGAHILKFVAPAIAAGIAARPDGAPRVAVMACENAINGTDILRGEVESNYTGDDLADRALFANTAVDRIVPAQAPDAGLDVTVENYFEWAIETPPFGGDVPDIPGVTWVDDLEPYIERKLFTVNTGHATAA
ncbi:MAG: mannitol-1-phosphate 5-dehydrogenase, partial [Propionibacterium sp.]|nr:mannitol-1-phosphate 5-dehydrogenase [Propionibacterium sp.]